MKQYKQLTTGQRYQIYGLMRIPVHADHDSDGMPTGIPI
jgi:hypothetical protein